MPDSSSVKPRFRLAIVGGGIAGLSLAATLAHYDRTSPIEVHLYESGAEITTTGSGISIWPRTWSIMRQLGLQEQLRAASVGQTAGVDTEELKPAFVCRKSDSPHDGYEFGKVMAPEGSTTMHRADLVDLLVKSLPERYSIHFCKRLVRYSERTSDDGTPIYTLHFADGTRTVADVVIGADGIKSRTRMSMYDYAHRRECPPDVKRDMCSRCSKAIPKWTGTVAYRYSIPTDRMQQLNPDHSALKAKSPMSYCGKGKHIITYPLSNGNLLDWVGFVTIPEAEGTAYPYRWVTDVHQTEVAAHFYSWEFEVLQMLELIEKPTLWAIHHLEDLPFSVSGAVALMGDAVHAMTTHFAAGGGQAIEDAYILGRLLADPRTTLTRVPEVFKIYQDVRLPFAREVVRKSRKVGFMYEFDWPGMYDGSPVAAAAVESEQEARAVERLAVAELGKGIQEMWQWQWKDRVEEQQEEAARRFTQLVKGDRKKGVAARMRRLLTSCVIM